MEVPFGGNTLAHPDWVRSRLIVSVYWPLKQHETVERNKYRGDDIGHLGWSPTEWQHSSGVMGSSIIPLIIFLSFLSVSICPCFVILREQKVDKIAGLIALPLVGQLDAKPVVVRVANEKSHTYDSSNSTRESRWTFHSIFPSFLGHVCYRCSPRCVGEPFCTYATADFYKQ